MKQLTIVAGLGRCGSSCLMRMLQNAGLETTGDAESPMWEDSRATHGSREWMTCTPPMSVVKVLAPHKFPPPKGGIYRWIWLHRNPVEQKRSQIKWAKWWAEHTGKSTKRIDYDIAEWTALGLAAVKQAGGPLLELRYEDILEHPVLAALAIEEFLDFEVNPAALAAMVDKRAPGCLKRVSEADYVSLPGFPRAALRDGVRW